MKVLLLHPEDVPWRGPWSGSRWDLVVDLGFAGSGIYQEWSQRIGARVVSLHQFAGQGESYRWVNQALEAGRNRLLDRMGLDWWEILACWSYHELQGLYLIEQLCKELRSRPDEVVATREHPYVRMLRALTGWPMRCVTKTPSSVGLLGSRISHAARSLRPSQMVEIAFDKWDPSYRLRSRLARRLRAELKEPVVLLPSAYSSVTRVQLAYAHQLPKSRFLLATTRRSGESKDLPSNVNSICLSAYAEDSGETQVETAEMIKAWNVLKHELSQTAELRPGFAAGAWDHFPHHLQNGLRLRDAWQLLLSCEPVNGVLCGDDLNYYTRLPLILAKRMGRTAIYCYHGALDGGLLFKKSYADVHLVKGEMEREYVLRASHIDAGRIEIGAPGEVGDHGVEASKKTTAGGDLVLFSQPFEVSGGRTLEIYREILPRLAKLAQQAGCKMVIKLHPFESVKSRDRLLKNLLPVARRAAMEISNASASTIMERAWFGIGVDSSVAVECTLRGIPYFLCGWLDFNGFGYMRQFARFGAGIVLDAPEEISSIPRRLAEFRQDHSQIRRLWCPADDARLDEIMFGCSRMLSSTKCAS